MFVFTTLSLFLGGLTAAAVPIVFHFLMQGKPKQIEFPALMFISQNIETHRRKLQLKNVFLLTLRILAVVLIGLALARPILKLGNVLPNWAFSGDTNGGFVSTLATSLGSQDAPVAAAIVIDNSVRMEYVAENKTRLDAAKKFAAWVLEQLPQNSSIAVLSCAGGTNAFQVDNRAAAEKINRLQTAAAGKPVCEVVKNAAALLKSSELEERELYVITDLSEPGWSKEAGGITPASLSGIGVFIIDVSVSEAVNAAIQRVTVIPESVPEDTPLRFDMTVSHTGPAVSKSVELVLGSEGKETVRMTKTVDFPAGYAQKPLTMMLAAAPKNTITSKGTTAYQGKIRFSAGDALAADDQYWFSYSVEPIQKFLLLAQPPVRESALYFRQALEAAAFAVEEMPFSELPGLTPQELQKFNAVVLLDPPPLQANVWQKLSEYVSAGYGAGVFLGTNADSLPSFNHPAATDVLGAKLVRQARNPDGNLWLVPGLSPLFLPFHSLGTGLGTPTTLPLAERFPWMTQTVFRYWQLGELSPRSEIAATFSDQRPAVLTQTLGRGHTVTVAVPVSELPDSKMPWNLWTRGETSWMFVLFSEGIAKY
ncbi:MAG: BatA domain-containing protein, partial [Planctomycetaceae bacterium]|nr:BatA domain-containing protein [Planctomycetaceae bacterium]